MSVSSENQLYLIDHAGSVTPELERHEEVVGMAHTIVRLSVGIAETAAGLRNIAADLSDGHTRTPGLTGKKHTFQSEAPAREELIKLADFLTRLNVRVWSVSKALGSDAYELANRVHVAEDKKFDEDLRTYVESPAAF